MDSSKIIKIILLMSFLAVSCGKSEPQDISADKRDFMAACSQNIDEATEIDEALQYDNGRIIEICQCAIDDVQATENTEVLKQINEIYKEDGSAALPEEALNILASCITEKLSL